ncbi:hypothetical protein Tco_0936125 [Tanacetum coccineum]
MPGDDGFIEVKKKKSGGNNRGKNVKQFSVKQKIIYHLKPMQSAEWTSNSPKTTPFVVTNKASTSGYNKDCTKSQSNKGNGFSNDVNLVSHSNSFEALNVEYPVIEEVATGNEATTSGTQGKLVFVDNDGKSLEKVDYSGNTHKEDEFKSIDHESASYLALNPMGVGYGPKSLCEQWRVL